MFSCSTGLDVEVSEIVHIAEKFSGSEHALFVTFRGHIVGGKLGTTDGEIQRVEWVPLTEAQRRMPYHSDVRGLLHTSIPYAVE